MSNTENDNATEGQRLCSLGIGTGEHIFGKSIQRVLHHGVSAPVSSLHF